jgi:predicted O-methyltransferase YrrM
MTALCRSVSCGACTSGGRTPGADSESQSSGSSSQPPEAFSRVRVVEQAVEKIDLEAIRASYRRESGHLALVGARTRTSMEALIDHERFAGSTDPVVLELLGGILRAARPTKMLQFGTWIGYSMLLIADLLVPGQLVTVDPAAEAHETARASVRDAGLENVTFLDGHSTDPHVVKRLLDIGPFSLAYVDSSHSYRGTLEELELLFDGGLISAGGLVMFHDAAETAVQFDPTGEGGVPRALQVWSHRLDTVVLEQPVFPSVPGLALVRLRNL